MYHVYWNQTAAAYLSFYFSFFFLSNFLSLNFSSHFSQELWGLEGSNLLHTWKMGGCIVYTGIMLLLIFVPLFFFIFLSLQFSNIKNFRHTFLRNCEARRLKLGTHVDSGQMYCVYRNQATAVYSSLYSFFFLSNFQTLKFFVTLFSGTVMPRRLKLGTHVDSGQMYCIYRNQAAAAYSSLYFSFRQLLLICPFISSFFFLSIFRHTFLRNCEA